MKVDINKVELKLTDTDDPIASKVDWTPLRHGGSNFRTSHLEKISSNLLEIKPSIYMLLFLGVFFLIGSILMVLGLLESDYLRAIFGLVFILAPLKFIAHSLRIVQIDAIQKQIKHKKNVFLEKLDSSSPISEHFKEIHAIQVVGEYVSSNSGSSSSTSNYKSFEINLVLKNLRRVCLIDHGGHNTILNDAKTISQFLNVPLWDAT